MTIRPAKPTDLEALIKINYEVWHHTYKNLYPASFVSEQTPERMRKAWERTLKDRNPASGWFVAELDGKVCGYAGAGRVPDMGIDYHAELYSIYVLPSAQGKGTGSKLLGECVRFLAELGAESLLVWIPEENPFNRFYKKTDAELLDTRMEVDYGGKAVPVIAFGWKDLSKLKKL